MGIRSLLRPLLAAILAVPVLLSSRPSLPEDGGPGAALTRQLLATHEGGSLALAAVAEPDGSEGTIHEVRVPGSSELLYTARLVPPAAPIRVGVRGGVEPSYTPDQLAPPARLHPPTASRQGDPYEPRPHAFAATGGQPPYFPTAPPLHG